MRRRNVVLWCFLGRSKRPANQDVQPSLQFMEPQMMTQLLAGAPPPLPRSPQQQTNAVLSPGNRLRNPHFHTKTSPICLQQCTIG